MKVVRHKADAKHFHRELTLSGKEQIQEGLKVTVFLKDYRSTISSIQNMVGMATDLSARDPRHGVARYLNKHFRRKKK